MSNPVRIAIPKRVEVSTAAMAMGGGVAVRKS
jgi:hypothetical protein